VLIIQLSAPHDWRALEAKWMGVGRLNHNSLHRRIGKSATQVKALSNGRYPLYTIPTMGSSPLVFYRKRYRKYSSKLD
jgi:hypothetical protein